VPFRDTSPHRTLGPRDFGAFSSLLLAEHREKDDSPSARDVVGDAYGTPNRPEVEPELTELAAQLACVGFGEVNIFSPKRSM
jgi:hypothetical protein